MMQNVAVDLKQKPGRKWGWRRIGIGVLVGLPLTSLLLIASQPSFEGRLLALRSQWFSPLEAPYRYPFYGSLGVGERNPAARLQQEIAFYQNQVQRYPDRALDQAALASAYFRMGRLMGEPSWYLLAEQTARQSLDKLAVDNLEALAVLARTTEARHDFAGALRLAQQLPSRESLPIQVSSNLALGNLSEAGRAAEQLVDQTLSQNAFTLQALVQAAQGQDQAALDSFRYALEVEEVGELSQSARTRLLLGRFYYERGELQQATHLYQEALQILPNSIPALLNLAQVALNQGEARTAEGYYAQAARLTEAAPTVFEPLILRGQAQAKRMQGRQAEAEALWARAETLLRQDLGQTANLGQTASNPSPFSHRRDLARLLLERGRQADVAEAVTLMAAEVKQRRDIGTLNTYLAALTAAQRWTEATAVLKQALATGNRDLSLLARAAALKQASGLSTSELVQSEQWVPQFQDKQIKDKQTVERMLRAADLGTGLGL